MKKSNIFLVLIIAVFASCNSNKNKEENSMEREKAIDLANMNTDIKPGEDFFQYANGGWMADNPIPEEYSRYGAFEVLDKKSKYQIREIIFETLKNKKAEKNSPEQQIRDYYTAAMDTVKIDELGYNPIKPLLKDIDKITTKEELFQKMVELNEIGVSAGFHLFASIDDKNSKRYIPNLMQGGLGLPDRDYYTS
jgi:putative endopeptidase